MISNEVGRTGVRVTQLGLGTAQLGDLYDSLDQADADAIVGAAWECGIRYFDTAPHYGLGLSEVRLGRALRGISRDDYTLSSKVGRLVVDTERGPERRWDFSRSGVERSIDDSLSRLQIDRLDIALLHDPHDYRVDLARDEAIPSMCRLRDAGVVGAVGVGAADLPALIELVTHCDVDVVMIAGRLTLLEHPAVDELLPLCASRGISVLNAAVFNSGLLATELPGEDARYDYSPAPADVRAKARRLAALCARHGVPLPQAALAFARRHPSVASVVVGADSADQVRRTATLFEEAPVLDALWAEIDEGDLHP